jgi:serine phosphatase RsbU (regulator of sigma subunit)
MTGRLGVDRGGQPPALRQRGAVIDWPGRDDEAGFPLGILREHRWHDGDTDLCTADLLALYADGLVEARAPLGETFGSGRPTAPPPHPRHAGPYAGATRSR